MTLHLWLQNLAAYSAQIAVIVAAGAALPYLLRIRHPRTMLAVRQTLLAACVLLPFLQPWNQPEIESSPEQVSISMTPVRIVTVPARSLSAEQAIALLLAAGIVARLGWLLIGLRRLRRYRRQAVILDPAPASFAAMASTFGIRPRFFLSTGVSGPVTFGARNPVILLPAQFLEMPSGAQEAIVCHELVHVRRRDWAFTIAEELVRAVFWFHPAVWWLLGQIQLTREQTVDREVIAITAAREQYIGALLAVAGARLDLAPAPLFLKKSHLSQRVALLLKEVSMSQRRLLSSLGAIGAALVITARLAVLSFPISAPAQTVLKGDIGLLHRAPIEYPAEALEKGVQGTVVVEATLSDRGTVTDARVVSGLEPLRKAALKSVLEWHYSLPVQSPVQVAIDFTLPVRGGGGIAGAVPAPTPAGRVRLGAIKLSGVPAQLRDTLEARIPYRVGDELGPDAASRLKQVLREIDEHLESSLAVSYKDGVAQPQEAVLTVFFTAPLLESPTPSGAPQRIRVGGNIQAAMVLNYVRPVYPAAAKQAKIQGKVQLNLVIGADGVIQDIKVASGPPELVTAALDAVKLWTYKPTLLNGQPVEVATVVDVNFTLAQ